VMDIAFALQPHVYHSPHHSLKYYTSGSWFSALRASLARKARIIRLITSASSALRGLVFTGTGKRTAGNQITSESNRKANSQVRNCIWALDVP
jgi:hypothetical protein